MLLWWRPECLASILSAHVWILGFRLVAALVFPVLVLLTWAGQVWAGSPAKVIIVAGTEDGVARQLRSELVARGFEPIFVQESESGRPTAFYSETASERQAIGVLKVVEDATAVQVWASASNGGRLTLTDLVFQAGHSETDDSVVAVRAVEVLRAATQTRQIRSEVVRRSGVAPVGSRAQQPHSVSRFALGAGPSLLLNPAGMDRMWNASFQLDYQIAPRFRVQAWVSLPVSPASVSNQWGTSQVRAEIIAAALNLSSEGNVRGYSGLGVGLLRMSGQGSAIAPGVGLADASSAALVFSKLGGFVRVHSNLCVWVEVLGGVSLPKVQVSHGEAVAATAGRPLIGSTTGLALSW